MLYTFQLNRVTRMESALADRKWKEAYHLLASMGFPYQKNTDLDSDGERKFKEKESEFVEKLRAAIDTYGAKAHLVRKSLEDRKADASSGLGKACTCDAQWQAVHKFLTA